MLQRLHRYALCNAVLHNGGCLFSALISITKRELFDYDVVVKHFVAINDCAIIT